MGMVGQKNARYAYVNSGNNREAGRAPPRKKLFGHHYAKHTTEKK